MSALAWSISGEFVVQGMNGLFVIVLARLLPPSDFGLVAMVVVFTQFLLLSIDLGFEEALVQRREVSEIHYASVFWTMVVTGTLVSAAFLRAGPALSAFYGAEGLSTLVPILAPIFLFRALAVVPRAMLVKRLAFRTKLALRGLAVAIGGSTAVALALRDFGAASLAVQILVTTTIDAVLVSAATAWLPPLAFRLSALRDLLHISAYRPATRSLTYWAHNLDQLLIGRFQGATSAGIYGQAFSLARLPVQFVSRATLDAMFPSLSLIQGDKQRVRAVFLRLTAAVALATFPMCLGLFAVAETLVVGVLGPRWHEAVPLVRILSIAAVFTSVGILTNSLFLAEGRADVQFRLLLAQRVTTMAAVVFALRWGTVGVAFSHLACAALFSVPAFYVAGKLVDLHARDVAARLGPVLLASVGMAALVLGAHLLARSVLPVLPLLGIEIALGVSVYAAALRLLRVDAFRDVMRLARLQSS